VRPLVRLASPAVLTILYASPVHKREAKRVLPGMSDKLSYLTALELENARNVQARVLPYSLPRIQGLDYYGDSRPADEVGTDFFDFISYGSGKLALSVGDVSGRGLAAAILMSGLQSLLRGLSNSRTCEIANVVREVNRTVCDVSPDNLFASLFHARVDAADRQLQYVSAGHEPALLVRGNGQGVQILESTGAVLGLTRRIASPPHGCVRARRHADRVHRRRRRCGRFTRRRFPHRGHSGCSAATLRSPVQ
jgi:serine phosphatase RsbU (regulator of sigma subunit)